MKKKSRKKSFETSAGLPKMSNKKNVTVPLTQFKKLDECPTEHPILLPFDKLGLKLAFINIST